MFLIYRMKEFMDYIKEIADALNNNHAVAMIGAGFSKNAVKTTSSDKYF